ncbi:MAG: hypothetical protein KF861_04770 [Planctomycetaceae bacterium]|nr:hypothetical protein [Planctomycetaceae bacterium]
MDLKRGSRTLRDAPCSSCHI